MSRGKNIYHILDVFETLLDGRPRLASDFKHLNISSRHIRRLLQYLSSYSKFQIHYSRDSGYWYCNYRVQKFIKKFKRCVNCKELKESNNFSKNSYSQDGRQMSCKECQVKKSIKWRNENRNKYNNRQRRRYRLNRNKELKRRKDYYEENREIILKKKKEKYQLDKKNKINHLIQD